MYGGLELLEFLGFMLIGCLSFWLVYLSACLLRELLRDYRRRHLPKEGQVWQVKEEKADNYTGCIYITDHDEIDNTVGFHPLDQWGKVKHKHYHYMPYELFKLRYRRLDTVDPQDIESGSGIDN